MARALWSLPVTELPYQATPGTLWLFVSGTITTGVGSTLGECYLGGTAYRRQIDGTATQIGDGTVLEAEGANLLSVELDVSTLLQSDTLDILVTLETNDTGAGAGVVGALVSVCLFNVNPI